jgi:hypothetical protein
MALSQLIYFSELRDLGEAGAERILEQSRKNHEDAKVTGVLLFDRNYFLQCLEGSREDVTATFLRIAADPRHANITLISVHDVEERDFSDWTMGYVVSKLPEMTAILHEFSPTGNFAPALLSAPAAIALMKRMRDMKHTV